MSPEREAAETLELLFEQRRQKQARLATLEGEQRALALEHDQLVAAVARLEARMDELEGDEVTQRDAGMRFVANAREQLEGGGRRP